MKRLLRGLAALVLTLASAVFVLIRRLLRGGGSGRSLRTGPSRSGAVDAGGRLDPVVERRASRRIGVLLLASIAAALGLLVVYARGGQPQLEGALLGVALGGIGMALILWGKHLFPAEEVTGDREPHPSERGERDAAERSFAEGGRPVARRAFLARLLIGAAGALGLAAIFPIRSLGPSPGTSLLRTSWRRGFRLVTEEGVPIRAIELQPGSAVTVFPEGHLGEPDSVAVVVKVEPGLLHLPPDRADWAPEGNVCYSKLCTHAGCPVGLYSAETHQLQCPCHQSAFDVTAAAEPVFGPAARPLPQLPITVDENGYLTAAGDFSDPVGPGFWNREAGIPDSDSKG
ncbi:MAG: Rieske 2Fe-2S domain-containing protein [Actinobacteria bacterium]|nr:Rieske 2Fe-2S domain-containing protein [Actinomycetota bacterium]